MTLEITFDPAKDAANVEKHGLSLRRFVEMEVAAVVEDDRFYEPRLRVYGLIDGRPHCAAVTTADDGFRVISLRRAHSKEYTRHVESQGKARRLR